MRIGNAPLTVLVLGPVGWTTDKSATVPVELVGTSIKASTTLALEDWNGGADRFLDYVDDLAAAWRGWEGTKLFDDDRSTVSIAATHDRVGTVTLRVDAKDGPLWTWRVMVDVSIEPGALERIAADCRALFSRDIPAR